ncbi:hypothetical protein Tco_0111492 [Tanacetum coccineum]
MQNQYGGLEYSDADVVDFEERLERIYSREIHKVQVVDFQGMPELIRDGLFARMVMEHRDDADIVIFTSRAWGRLFDTRGPLVRELILEFLSTLRFGEVLLDLDAPGTIQFQLGGARRRLSWRFLRISPFLQFDQRSGVETFPSYDGIRYCWEESGTRKDRYLRRFDAGKKCGGLISWGQFVAGLAEHFGLLTAEILGGLTVIAPELLIIDMGEMVRFQIYMEVDDTWAWVSMGPERLFCTHEAPQQPTPPPPATARTMPQRLGRLEEEVQGLRRDVGTLRGLVERSMIDQGRFSNIGDDFHVMAQLMDASGLNTRHSMGLSEGAHLQHSREFYTRQRTGEASTSAAQQTHSSQTHDPLISLSFVLIMEYLVKVSKRRAFWSLNQNEDILKITILKTNTLYGVSVPVLTNDHKGMKSNTPYPEEVNTPY